MTTLDTLDFRARLYRRSTKQVVAPATPATPAQTSYETVRICGYYPVSALPANVTAGPFSFEQFSTDVGFPIDEKQMLVRAWSETGVPFTVGGQWTYLCGFAEHPTTTPATAGTPEISVEATAPGWDAAAESVTGFFRAGRVRFRAQAGKRMVVGIQEGPDPLDPLAVCFGFMFGIGHPAASGYRGRSNEATPALNLVHGFATGLDDETVYTVELLPGVVNYSSSVGYSGSMSLRDTIYDRPGVWTLGAAIYDPGAWVEGVEVTPYSGAALATKPMQMLGGKSPQRNFAALRTPAMTLAAGLFTRGALVTPKARMRCGDYPLAEAYMTMPSAHMSGQQAVGASIPYAMLRSPRMTMSAHCMTGTVARASMTLPGARMRATQGLITEAALVSPAARMFAADIPPGEARMSSVLFAEATATAVSELVVVMNTAGGLAPTIAAAVLVSADMPTALSLTDALTLSQVMDALMETAVRVGADVPAYAQQGEVWVMGLSEHSPTSTFENYDFNSFGVVGGRTYGVKSDGLYLLEGDTDDGDPIRASVSYGAQDFGGKTMKHMTRAYVGASSTGKLYLKIVADGKEYLYAARSSSTNIAQQRFDVGRGLQANYFTFELFNRDGGDFEIDSVSFFAAEFKRRI